MNGALLTHKKTGVSSFGVIELLQRQWIEKHQVKKRDLPKIGHGGTLDPFATGLLVVLVGRAVKLARYFLGSSKGYEGVMRFGETTIPGDLTDPISERSDTLPASLQQLQTLAYGLTLQPYLQTPPMHSAKKRNGKPLYELARAGIEVDREPKLCHLYEFEILDYSPPQASFQMKCSSGTYVRTLAQDFAKMQGTVALLDSLHRTSSGLFNVRDAWTLEQISEATQSNQKWDQLPCWIPFDQLLQGYPRAEATADEKRALVQGQQTVLYPILKRVSPPENKSSEGEDCVAIYCSDKSQSQLIAIARKEREIWGIERVFTD